MPNKFWEIKNSADNIGELFIYGDLADTTWWGDEVTPKQFNADLDGLGAVDELHLRINSYGGDVFAGHAIYNSIKNFKRKHACTVKGIVDGIAASATSVVLQAADIRIVSVNGMVMVHDPMLGLCGYYNESDLLQYLDAIGPIKESIVAAYHDRSGVDKSVIAETMKNETWMTAEKAIELGYADVIDSEVSLDLQMKGDDTLVINNVEFDKKHFKNAPSKFMNMAKRPVNKPVAKVVEPKKPETSNNDEEEIMNIQDLKNKYPDLYKEVHNLGSTEERERIKNIENIARPGDEKLVNSAKFEKPVNASELAMQMIAADKVVQNAALNHLESDAGELGDVKPPVDSIETEQEEMDADIANMVKMMNKAE